MKKLSLITFMLSLITVVGCSTKHYLTNGERIYQEGKNLSGDKLLDKRNSSISFIRSCRGCHGSDGKRLRYAIISWSGLTDPGRKTTPYTDSLFFRFIERDLKSDGSQVKTGVHWKMSTQDKEDLITFLKSL